MMALVPEFCLGSKKLSENRLPYRQLPLRCTGSHIHAAVENWPEKLVFSQPRYGRYSQKASKEPIP